MLTAAISTLALALALGPQLQVSLQAALDEAQPVQDASETVTETVDEVVIDPSFDVDSPIEPVQAPVMVEELAESLPAPTGADEPAIEAPVSEPIILSEQTEDVLPNTDAEAPVAPAQNGDVPEADWPAILAAASAALANAETAKGQFIQTNVDGTVSTGTFALNRPGRMRFDYDDPTPILIVSDGTTVAMEDSELETVDRVPIGSTPLGLILATDLNVDEDVDVLGVMENSERVGIRVSDSSGELEGTLTMVFEKESYDLLGWLATDGNFQTTVVDLLDVETNVRVDPRLFRLDEDEDEEDER